MDLAALLLQILIKVFDFFFLSKRRAICSSFLIYPPQQELEVPESQSFGYYSVLALLRTFHYRGPPPGSPYAGPSPSPYISWLLFSSFPSTSGF